MIQCLPNYLLPSLRMNARPQKGPRSQHPTPFLVPCICVTARIEGQGAREFEYLVPRGGLFGEV